jgi:hypothetical protein
MILDELTEFADAVSVAAAAGTANIGDQIDLGIAGRDIGNGEPIYLVLTVDTEIITGGSAGTVAFQLVSDDTASIATDGTQSIHWRSSLFVTDDTALAELDVGDIIAVVPLPGNGQEPYERYLGVQAVTATTTTTAGKINAFLTKDPTPWKAYPQASVAD